ncbi:flagellar type III secretion system pore protein FliP [Desulfoscipio gibsoniae]|uniref:Flagellar biosynthetic protein FliP n=1 Tax=Desulfoscipio gibsoniae DSM 7213 TaxID=767817 RepID=R4KPR4_9FIRM|nr:flagellar type III secretion system pore protein FliP [Desulfoscipio gibsoniae]AGL01646.1 flagellar biosynthetic protein FliP [Desulfoscipio gibsoniae DSM 7213]
MQLRKGLIIITLISFIGLFLNLIEPALAAPLPGVDLNIQPTEEPIQVVNSIKILIMLTLLSLVPAFLLMMTSFTRIIVVLSLLRSALGTQQTPPNQVIIGLALFLTVFIMTPVAGQINEEAIQPYLDNQISQQQAWDKAYSPLRSFMLKQTREKDLALFIKLSGTEKPENRQDVSAVVLIPAYVISELKTAFQIGFMIYIPFLVIDMVVASTLMSMGMFMLPPVMISLPFKILLFVMVDGWYLVVKTLVESF